MNIPHHGLRRQYLTLRDELLHASDLALKTGQLVNGVFTKQFEEWLRRRTKAKYALTVASGTQALEFIARSEFAIASTPSRPHPKIKITNFSYPATLNAFITAGWDIELCDTDRFGIYHPSDEDEYSCVVGLYGKPVDAWPNVIVDGAQHWLVADGNFGSGMAISFDPTKNLPSSGNGGAVVTDDKSLYDFVHAYRRHGGEKFAFAGTNSCMSEQDCAQLLVRTKYIDQWQLRRAEIARYWVDLFQDLPLRCLCEDQHNKADLISASPQKHAYQKFVVYTSDRYALHTNLLLDGVESKIHYGYTLAELEESRVRNFVRPDLTSVSMMLSRGVLSLPFYPELTDAEVEFIAERVIAFYAR